MQLLIFNEEFLVSACHQRALITSLPFVHTARRSYRLNDPVRPPDCGNAAGSPAAMPREAVQTLSFRGRRSRNKVSVGEPAEGSLPVFPPLSHSCERCRSGGRRARWRLGSSARARPLRASRLGVRGSSFRRAARMAERRRVGTAGAACRARRLLARRRSRSRRWPPSVRRARVGRGTRLVCLRARRAASVRPLSSSRRPVLSGGRVGGSLLVSSHLMNTTLADGYLGSRNDEERSEMRYVVRIAEFSESSNL